MSKFIIFVIGKNFSKVVNEYFADKKVIKWVLLDKINLIWYNYEVIWCVAPSTDRLILSIGGGVMHDQEAHALLAEARDELNKRGFRSVLILCFAHPGPDAEPDAEPAFYWSSGGNTYELCEGANQFIKDQRAYRSKTTEVSD